jgi:ubiquinone/menaquinone biosynthesis C-methylase UbiE
MIQETIPASAAQRFYNRLGARHDWAELYEGHAKDRALALLRLAPGLTVLNAGVGTGTDHRRIVAAVEPGGMAVGVDLASVMLDLTRRRTGSPVVRSDIRRLPFRTSGFDRLLSAYVLDLLPARDLPRVLGEFHRVLRPGGVMVLVSLTEGASPASRLVIRAWRAIYRRRPLWLGGCRPIPLAALVGSRGFDVVADETVIQLAVPSAIVAAVPSRDGARGATP